MLILPVNCFLSRLYQKLSELVTYGVNILRQALYFPL